MAAKETLDGLAETIRFGIEDSSLHSIFKKDLEQIWAQDHELPDELKTSDYKSFVRVKVVVQPDGSFTPVLRTSSGNIDIDNRVLEALKKWTWKPALKNGQPVESTAYFRFEFEVD